MTWTKQIVSSSPQVSVRFDMTQGSQNTNGNYTNVNWSIQSITSNGSRTGTWDYKAVVNGSTRANSSNSSTHSGTQTLASGSYQVGHDANGNKTVSGSGWLDAYYGSGTASGSITLSRIARAPYGLTQSLVSTSLNGAVINLDISSRGHGTSAAHKVQYRKNKTGTVYNTADQSCTDTATNTFTLTGLSPNTLYDFRQQVWNNNGDTAYGSYQDLVTLSEVFEAGTANIQAVSYSVTNAKARAGHYTNYSKIQYRKKGDSTWLNSEEKSGDTFSITITGLLPSTTYERRFVCRTTAGTTTNATHEFTTLPAAKLVMPNGDVKNAIPWVIMPNGSKTMRKVKII